MFLFVVLGTWFLDLTTKCFLILRLSSSFLTSWFIALSEILDRKPSDSVSVLFAFKIISRSVKSVKYCNSTVNGELWVLWRKDSIKLFMMFFHAAFCVGLDRTIFPCLSSISQMSRSESSHCNPNWQVWKRYLQSKIRPQKRHFHALLTQCMKKCSNTHCSLLALRLGCDQL